MTDGSIEPGQGSQRLARVLEYVLLCILLVLPAVIYVWRTGHLYVGALHIALVLPLFWRRRFPELAFAVVAVVALVQWRIYEPMPSDAALLVSLYGIASTATLKRTLYGVATLEVGIVLVAFEYPNFAAGLGIFTLLTALTTQAAVLGVNAQNRRAYLHEVEQRAARLAVERDQERRLATAAEQARVAREMHDIVAHNISVMVALTDGASLTMPTDPDRAAVALAEASRAGRTALTDMRRVLGLLRPEAAPARDPAPQLTSLDDLITTVRHTGLDVRYRTTGPIAALPDAVQLSIFRVVQEALTNVMKHAHGARAATVSITARGGEVVITIQDDAPPTGTDPGTGLGLIGMRERAALHDGAVTAGPTNTGWRTEARLRLDDTERESTPA